MIKTAREPRALPWVGMSQAFGLNAGGAANEHEFSSAEMAEDVGNEKR